MVIIVLIGIEHYYVDVVVSVIGRVRCNRQYLGVYAVVVVKVLVNDAFTVGS